MAALNWRESQSSSETLKWTKDGRWKGFWVESAARAFTSDGIRAFRGGICQYLYEEVVGVCGTLKKKPDSQKRCLAHYTEIPVVSLFNRSQIKGLYPGQEPKSLQSWQSNRTFWKNELVDKMSFPFAKVSHGFLDTMPQAQKKDLLSCLHDMPDNQRSLHLVGWI